MMASPEATVTLVYAERPSRRLAYVCRVLEVLLGQPFQATGDLGEVLGHVGPKLYYGLSKVGLPGGITVTPQGLLADGNLLDAALPADAEPLAQLFYLAVLGGEYLPGAARDAHGRLRQAPYVKLVGHRLAWALGRQLEQAAGLEGFYRLPPATDLATYDIDNAWAFAHKGLVRWAGSLAKDVLAARWGQVGGRLGHALGLRPDPYDRHEILMAENAGAQPWMVFFLMRTGHKHDRAVHYRRPAFGALVRRYVEAGATLGLHPSYECGQNLSLLQEEKDRLEQILGQAVIHSRQHYLRLLVPHTCRVLEQAGIERDYSLASAGGVGFVSGLAVPLPWYDVEQERVSGLTLHPSCWMDAPWVGDRAGGLKALEQMLAEVAAWGGEAVVIRHNEWV